jgi:hypothetical protein
VTTRRSFCFILLVLFSLACSHETGSKRDESLVALAEKVREEWQASKIGGDVAVQFGLRKRQEDIPAYGQAVAHEPTREIRAILVSEVNDIVITFGNGSVEYWTLTDTSGKLRKAFRAEPGKPASDVAVTEVQPRLRRR